jgi:hypothetical protein
VLKWNAEADRTAAAARKTAAPDGATEQKS